MKTVMIAVSALVLTSCATKPTFVLMEETREWSIYKLQPDPVIGPMTLIVGTPEDGFVFPGVTVNPKTTRAFMMEFEDGRELEVFLLNGGESYEFNVLKDGKGFSHIFDENGKLLESIGYGRAR